MSSWKELKDSPLWILSSVIVATVVVTGGVYEKLVLPERVAQEAKAGVAQQLQAMADQAASEVQAASEAAARAIRGSADKAASEVRAAQKATDDANAKLRDYEQAHLLTDRSPYPLGLGKVKVGDSIDSLSDAYPGGAVDKTAIEDGNDYVVLKNQDPLFNHIVYYFDETDKKRRITHILFNASYPVKISDSLFRDRFTEMFGQPLSSPRKGHVAWKAGSVSVFMTDPTSFIVMRQGYVPGFW
ncbi:hypothetical protein [Paraburkholderia fungorum]|jgi:hypothetical protein|uniref:hypothetical protein n=1 Tax=Paraburkholderia fungorum TaxID=134537 RepID=UPI000FDAD5D4|nr:hypothetical protein [Paraburkholderia fungorum]MBB5542818.1 hypothetical protein [Paraburkholderia fungorum]